MILKLQKNGIWYWNVVPMLVIQVWIWPATRFHHIAVKNRVNHEERVQIIQGNISQQASEEGSTAQGKQRPKSIIVSWKCEEAHESLSGNYSPDVLLYREATLQAFPVKGKQQQWGFSNSRIWQARQRPAAHLWVTPWAGHPGWCVNDLLKNMTCACNRFSLAKK